jgi:PAS domain S-box-containing protein/putative nucleotidyltransferase with HDIG domain
VKSKLAIFIILSGWLFSITYIVIEYIFLDTNTISHFFQPQDIPHLVLHILLIIIPVVFTLSGYFVNESKKLFDAYKESEEKYRDFYQNAPDGYHSIGPDGMILDVNDKWLRMLGYQREEITGKKKLTELLTDEGLKIFQATLPEFKKKGFLENTEYDLIKKDGTRLPVVINATAFYDKDGNYLKSRNIVRDITEIKKREEKLIMSQSAFFNMLKDLDLSYKELKRLYEGLISSFISALDAKSAWTKGHSERVTNYAISIAKEMGLEDKDIETLRTAALLHDIGKLGTYDVILDKPEDLTDEEINLIKIHPVKGEEILKPISQLKDILPIIRSHHEKIDGTGYPDGLKNGDIPFLARIIAVADTFDSMTSDRPYRPKASKEAAISELKKYSGTQFDFEVVEAFSNTITKIVLF